jgi:vacuolar iron transporter family protein
MLGVTAASGSPTAILTAGIAGLAAGALSMAVGEYISVSSQKDSELADLEIEARSLKDNPRGELEELAAIYVNRGLEPKLADEVARQLHDFDPVKAHARDELGIDHDSLANPMQAALASSITFSLGSAVPIVAALFATAHTSAAAIVISSLVALAIAGAIGAYFGGGNRLWAAGRVLIGGSLAMAITAVIGHLIGSQL